MFLDYSVIAFNVFAAVLSLNLFFFIITHTLGVNSRTIIWCLRSQRVLWPLLVMYLLMGIYLLLKYLQSDDGVLLLTIPDHITLVVIWVSYVKKVWYKCLHISDLGHVLATIPKSLNDEQRDIFSNMTDIRVVPQWEGLTPMLRLISFSSNSPYFDMDILHVRELNVKLIYGRK